jgi:hypothetical protein
MPADKLDGPPVPNKWENISTIVSKTSSTSQLPSRAKSHEMLRRHQSGEVPHSSPAKPDGIIAKFKASKIEKKAALQHVENWYKGRIEATEHAVKEAVRVHKAEATKIAERLLLEINEEHFRYLASLGLRNEAARHKAMLELGDEASRTLREIEGRDWPPQLIEQAMHGVMERQRRFFEKLMEDLGEP